MRDSHRAAWTAFVEGTDPKPPTKYGNERVFFNGKWYPSKHEAGWAALFQNLASRGMISDYKEQERIVLVPSNGKLRSIVYVADFTFVENGNRRVMDAKGFKTKEYRLKKRLAGLLLGIEIEEL